MAAVESREAQRLQTDALRLYDESREHKRREGRERRQAKEKRQRADALQERCAELGIVVTFHESHITVPARLDPPESDLAAEAALQRKLISNTQTPQEGSHSAEPTDPSRTPGRGRAA